MSDGGILRRDCIRLLEDASRLCYAAGWNRAEMVAAVRNAGSDLPDKGLGTIRTPAAAGEISARVADCEIVMATLSRRRTSHE